MPSTAGAITQLLREAHDGNAEALNQVIEIVYQDLHRMARHHLRERFGVDRAGITLEPKDLVNETFLRLVKQRNRYDNRGHFFAIATRLMLRVLLDYHRKRAVAKRGAGAVRVSLSGLAVAGEVHGLTRIPDFIRALKRLEQLDARTAEVATMRLLWDLTVPEIAKALDLSQATIEREWRFGRRWLADAIESRHKG